MISDHTEESRIIKGDRASARYIRAVSFYMEKTESSLIRERGRGRNCLRKPYKCSRKAEIGASNIYTEAFLW